MKQLILIKPLRAREAGVAMPTTFFQASSWDCHVSLITLGFLAMVKPCSSVGAYALERHQA